MATASVTDCFEDLISIKGGCDDIVPSSGVYLDDIGLSLNNIDEFVTKDYKDSYALYKEKEALSMRIMENQIVSNLSDRFLSNTLVESQRLGFFQDNLVQIAGTAGKRKGINIELFNFDSYLDFQLDEISLQMQYSGACQVKVYDLITGLLLDTIPITTVSNDIVTIYPHKIYKSNRKKLNIHLEVSAVNGTVLSANTTYLRQNILDQGNCYSCSGSSGAYTFTNSYAWCRGVEKTITDPYIRSSLNYIPDTGGISIVYSFVCNHRDWMCTISQSLALAKAFKTAELLMDFALSVAVNERMNTFTFANGDQVEKRQLSYAAKYAESITNVLQNIRLPQDQNCFVCNSRTMNKIILP